MSINGRISLGVAFLTKNSAAGTANKCILHAEFLLQTKQYLLTKITYAHDSNLPLGLKSSETFCEDIAQVLNLLSKKVAAKFEKGYVFDVVAMEMMSEEDESWDGFQLLGTSFDPEIDAPVLSMQSDRAGYSTRIRRSKLREERRVNPNLANRIKRNLRPTAQKVRIR